VDPESGESSVSVLRGKVVVKKRRFRKVEKGKLVTDVARKKHVARKVDKKNVEQVTDVMADLTKDYDLVLEKQAQVKIVKLKEKIKEEAKISGMDEEEVEEQIKVQTERIEKRVAVMQVKAEEIVVVRGEIIEVQEQVEELEKPREISSEELKEIEEVFTEEIVKEALVTQAAPVEVETEAEAEIDTVAAVEAPVNNIPEILSEPMLVAYINNEYKYGLEATDADQDELSYKLVEGPQNMTVSPFSGVITWQPEGDALAMVKVKVDDLKGGEALQEYELQVKSGLEGVLSIIPEIGELKTRFKFNASDLTGDPSLTDLNYRWDFDGDGKWDSPKTGTVKVAKARYRYKKMGTYEPKLEISDGKGYTQVLTGMAVVDQFPKPSFTISPASGTPGVEFTFDASASTDNEKLAFRWDFNSDGKWDEPQKGYNQSAVVRRKFDKSYSGKARLQVKDNLGQKAIKMVEYAVSFGVIVKVLDILRVNLAGESILEGTAKDEDGKIVEYAWDFEGDGKFDWTSKESGKTSHKYKGAGKYNAVFKATSDDGSTATKKIMAEVFNAKPIANAGKDFTTSVGKKNIITGAGKDPDGKVKKYEWDFEGDGEFDYSSTKTGQVEYTYQKAGTYKATLKVISRDGGTGTDEVVIIVE